MSVGGAGANAGVRSSVSAILETEARFTGFTQQVGSALQRVSTRIARTVDELEDTVTSLKREVASLEDEIEAADEDDDTSGLRESLADASDRLRAANRQLRRLEECAARFRAQAARIKPLVFEDAAKARGFLRGAADDLQAYSAVSLDAYGASAGAIAGTALAARSLGDAEGHHGSSQAPVSQALNVVDAEVAKAVAAALSVIDSVHSDGVLPVLPVQVSNKPKCFGYLDFTTGLDGHHATRLAIDPCGPFPEFTTVHEVGHFIDIEALGSGGAPGSDLGGALDPVINAAARSQGLAVILAQAQIEDPVQREFATYLLDRSEVWARAYSQFIATRSTDFAMKEQLRTAQQLGSDAGQWADDDFEPIAVEIDRIFRRRGWIT